MENNHDTIKIPLQINILTIISILEAVVILIIFIINGQHKDAITQGIISFCFIFIVYISTKVITKSNPYFFQDINNTLVFDFSIIGFMVILLMFAPSMIDKRSYKIGNIQIKFPKENGFIYGFKDANNNYSSAIYYFEHCSIKLQKIYNNIQYTIFENIENNVNLDEKITENIRLKDIYNSNFSEGKIIINGKEWNTYYTQVDTIKYTIHYLVIDDHIYQISTANYNENPAVCTNKIDETFKTIQYNN